MSARDLTAITAGHALNPHDFGCSCGRWTYRVGTTNYGIDIPGHLIHVAEVVEHVVREQIAAEIETERMLLKAGDRWATPADQYDRGRLYGMSVAAAIADGAK